MLPVLCSTRVCAAVPSFIMTSPYFMHSRARVTRRVNQTADRTSAASLGSKLTNKRRDEVPLSSVAVKQEEEEAKICEQRPSSAPLSTGNVYWVQTLVDYLHIYVSYSITYVIKSVKWLGCFDLCTFMLVVSLLHLRGENTTPPPLLVWSTLFWHFFSPQFNFIQLFWDELEHHCNLRVVYITVAIPLTYAAV